MAAIRLIGLAALAASAPLFAANYVSNPGFEYGPGPANLTGGAGSAAPSAASAWSMYLNSAGSVSSSLVPATDTISPGGTSMIRVETDGTDNGLFQFPIPVFTYVSADFYVVSGVAQLVATGNFQYSQGLHQTTLLNHWQHLQLATSGGNEIALYSTGGPAIFYVDNVVANDTPFATVPEPASWALLIAGFGLTGAALRRRRLAV